MSKPLEAGVELVIRPEPSAAERAAIEQALAAASTDGRPGAWWRAGLAESLGLDDEAADAQSSSSKL